jgi:hypothetical protein
VWRQGKFRLGLTWRFSFVLFNEHTSKVSRMIIVQKSFVLRIL